MLDGEDKLIRSAKKGDQASFGLLYDHYITPIYRFVLFKVSKKEEAEDLTHDVFLSAWQNLRGYKPQGFPFSSWLYQIARNKVIDFYRTKKVDTRLDDLEEDALKVVAVADENLEKLMDLETVQVLIKQLRPDQQDVLIMKFIEDLSHSEIAAVLGKSEGAVRLIQYRAIQSLKSLLNNHGNGGQTS